MVFFLTFGIFVLFFIGMALGLLVQNKPLKGSCGGIANLLGGSDCQFCGGNPNKCEQRQKDEPSA